MEGINFMFRKQILAAAALSFLALGSASNAAGTPTLQMSITASGLAPNSSGLLSDTAHDGTVFYNAKLGDFSVVSSVATGIGLSNPTVGQGILLQNFSVTKSATSSPSSTLQIVLVEDNLIGTSSLQTIAEGLSATIIGGSTTGTTITMSDYIAIGGTDATFLNQTTGAYNPGSGTQVGPTLTINLNGSVVSGSVNKTPTAVTANVTSSVFAEAIVLTITTTPGTNITAGASFRPVGVPEPASMLSLGVGLAALGFARRRKTNAAR